MLCNCCNCCCEMLRFANNDKTKGVLAPSRFQAKVDAGSCTGCGMCVEICPVEAIALSAEDTAESERGGMHRLRPVRHSVPRGGHYPDRGTAQGVHTGEIG